MIRLRILPVARCRVRAGFREGFGPGRSDVERRQRVVERREGDLADCRGKLGGHAEHREHHRQRHEQFPVGRQHHDQLGHQSVGRVGLARRLFRERRGCAHERHVQHCDDPSEGTRDDRRRAGRAGVVHGVHAERGRRRRYGERQPNVVHARRSPGANKKSTRTIDLELQLDLTGQTTTPGHVHRNAQSSRGYPIVMTWAGASAIRRGS